MSRVFFILLFFSSSLYASEQVCFKEACFKKDLQITGDQTLPLQNAVLYRYYLFKVYTLAIYADPENYSPDNILKDVPKALFFQYHRDIEKSILTEGADAVLQREQAVPYRQIKDRIEQLNTVYSDLKEGDNYLLAYHPDRGLTLYQDQKELINIPGKDFAQAYFGIWLSKDPLSPGLRNDLLKLEN